MREQMNIVVVGHVDHGKSTVIGRLLADTRSLPQGKLARVRAMCERNARPFEYAFLLDALKDEQAQGITIDTARCFFKSLKRDYIILDAPGHIEFLKNMVTGAARAEAALLVIDAKEGVRENSRRHGYLLSMLGIRQIVVLVNKMDLIGFDLSGFERIRLQYTEFLETIGLHPLGFIPVAARDGVNLVNRAEWYDGMTALEFLDSFSKEAEKEDQPFRFAVQDVYKFTEEGDDRRILAGSIETGSIATGDAVVFYPSGKKSAIRSIESFNRAPSCTASAGQAIGFTLAEELYFRPGELMCRAAESPPIVGSRLRVHMFWLGKTPMITGKRYKLKLATARVPVYLAEVHRVLDASDLKEEKEKNELERHDVGECILETMKPVAFDLCANNPGTGRFVVVDNYEIAGGGIILEALSQEQLLVKEHVAQREASWESGSIPLSSRESLNGHKSKFVLITGPSGEFVRSAGKLLEKRLFEAGFSAYYLGVSNMDKGIGSDVADAFDRREETIRRLGELARIMTDSGAIFITAMPDADRHELKMLRELVLPQEILTIRVGKGVLGDEGEDLKLNVADPAEASSEAENQLRREEILPEFTI
ncbi:MAG: adenylyl-sulfate kinase [Acidobacteria bacterium]|nr:adenylyl-sulfate kinase [Acidobacteriota bacterium]